MSWEICESSINRCWEAVMKYCLSNAHSRNLCGKEYMLVDNVAIQLCGYTSESTLSQYCVWRLRSLEYYLEQVKSPGKYSELSRLYSFGINRFNQYEYAVKNIKKRKNIKPIVISIYDPHVDNRDYVSTPCISNISLYAVDGILNMQVNYSTMNIFRMGLFDYHQMAYLHHIFADDSHTEVGQLSITSVQVYMPVFDFIVGQKIFDNDNVNTYKCMNDSIKLQNIVKTEAECNARHD